MPGDRAPRTAGIRARRFDSPARVRPQATPQERRQPLSPLDPPPASRSPTRDRRRSRLQHIASAWAPSSGRHDDRGTCRSWEPDSNRPGRRSHQPLPTRSQIRTRVRSPRGLGAQTSRPRWLRGRLPRIKVSKVSWCEHGRRKLVVGNALLLRKRSGRRPIEVSPVVGEAVWQSSRNHYARCTAQ